jgi:phage terminase large subunit GpA-like protein
MPFDGLQNPRQLVRLAAARALRPPPERSVAAWADAERILGQDEGPQPGKWRTDRTPYLREVMEACSLNHPARRVTFLASAQVGKTNVELNLIGQIIAEMPCKVLVVMPSLDEAGAFNREKLEPMLANTPAVHRRLRQLVSRDENGSTTRIKRFPGGTVELTGANSSKGLQMRSLPVVILDELSEFPADVDGRGSPIDMAEMRTQAYTGREKIVAVSTPGTKGSCAITARYEQGSRGLFHLPCIHCDFRQAFKFTNLRWAAGRPSTATYHCEACGAGIDHKFKRDMLQAGQWVHEFPDLVEIHPSFRVNALYSPFVPWSWVAEQQEAAADDPVKAKVFTQNVKGEAYEPRYDVPSHELLWQRREQRQARRIPPGCLFVTIGADVQGDRIEWGAYAFDRHLGQHWIDGGILIGDPNHDPVWQELDEIILREWPDAWGKKWRAEAVGVDSGYLPQRVYAYARRHAHRAQPMVMALDGRPKWGLPPVGKPTPQGVDFMGRKIGTVLLWPIGTWDVKTDLAAALQLTEMGPDAKGAWPKGAMRFPAELDIGFFEQLTAEACVATQARDGFERRAWIKIRPRNEQWDIAVYARALARHQTVGFSETEWLALERKRLGPPEAVQADLAALWAPDLRAKAEEALRAAQAPEISQPSPAAAPPTVWGDAPRWGTSTW